MSDSPYDHAEKCANEGDAIKHAALPDHAYLDVRWGGPSRTIGCRLFHRLTPTAAEAVKRAVRHVAAVAGWSTSEDA